MSDVLDYLQSLQSESSILRAAVSEILETEQDDDKITEHEIVRGEFCTKVTGAENQISKTIEKLEKDIDDIERQITDLKSIRREMKFLKRQQKDDIDRLDQFKWNLIHSRRPAR